MEPASNKDTGTLDPKQHVHLYIERPEDVAVRETLEYVGTECVMISLIGARHTGKTNLLNRLLREYNAARRWVAIQIDMTLFASLSGEKWYNQCIAKCCERLQKRGIAVTMEAVRQACERKNIDPVWSPQGFAEMLRLACLSLPPGHRLLVALDEISRVPSTERGVLFGNIRAVHQASSAEDPEYDRLGMILAGAFVPAHLIENIEQSPFNVGKKIYMSLATEDQVQQVLQPLIARGISIEPAAIAAIYEWTGGLLYHVQRFREMLEQCGERRISADTINALATSILFDDVYLTRIRSHLEGDAALAKWAAKILKQPIKSNRNHDIIARLEMIGIIQHEPTPNQWVIVNGLCQSFLRQYFDESDGDEPALPSNPPPLDPAKTVKKEETPQPMPVALTLPDQGSTSMRGLSPALLKKLKAGLSDCGPFGSKRDLESVFIDERIAPWKDDIPEEDTKKTRIDVFVSKFLNRYTTTGQSVLVLFLQAVYDQTIREDACSQQLNDIAIEVAAAISTELPPLARNNLWRASATQAGKALPSNLGGYAQLPAEAEPSAEVASLPPGLPAQAFVEQLESLKNKEHADWLPVDFLEKGLQAARAVGRVEFQGDKIGTAFLVAPDLVLTNAHVIRDIPVLTQGGVRFNVGLQEEVQWRYFAEQVAQSPIESLDFALMRLKEPIAGVAPVTCSTEVAYPAQPANILQYPSVAGGLMQVALRYNAIIHSDPTRLYYVTDTDRGSSGSPVFDDNWRVIALHRAGIVDAAQRPVKNANQGVPLTAIEPLIRPYIIGG